MPYLIILAILFFIFLDTSNNEDTLTPQQKELAEKEKKRLLKIDDEFNQLFNMDMISLTGGGSSVWIKNNSSLNIDRIYFILNPPLDKPNNSDDGFEIARKIFNAGSFMLTEEGFRAPSRQNYSYVDLESKKILIVDHEKFIHTKTKEKFNRDRYQVNSIYINVEIEYKGKTFKKHEIYELN